ncbi:MAG: hypothetical protein FJW66_03705 [Actinobacteria bacterium]|nr:hypothetical protein [Actinomycetota bacterium]
MCEQELSEYIKCQKFIVKSELNYHWFNMKLNIAQSEFIEKTIDCIFDSLERIAEDLDKKKLTEHN